MLQRACFDNNQWLPSLDSPVNVLFQGRGSHASRTDPTVAVLREPRHRRVHPCRQLVAHASGLSAQVYSCGP